MFTPTELSVLQSALRAWAGPYAPNTKLNEAETSRAVNLLNVADNLAERVEEILQYNYEMERTLDWLRESQGL